MHNSAPAQVMHLFKLDPGLYATKQRSEPMFKRFCSHFFSIVWKVKTVIIALIVLIVTGGVVIAFVEKIPFGDAIYFSFVTGLTIGYGEIVAKTLLGRLVALLIVLI